MLRALAPSSGAALAQLQQTVFGAAWFSTAPAAGAMAAPPAVTAPTKLQASPKDYSQVMAKAYEISADIIKPNDTEVGQATGIPLSTYSRKARIYSSAKSASQSGVAKTLHNSNPAPSWRIAFETTAKWENPLMGWTSTADPLENVARASLFFFTKDEAIAFCKKHGWGYTVDLPNQRRPDRQKRFNGYGDNFSVKRKGVPDLSHLPSVRLGLGTPAPAK